MGSQELPWMKFWVADWLTDESIALMSPREKGVFIDLICHCWDKGSIPDDSERLRRLVRVSPEIWDEVWPALEQEFVSDGNGRLKRPSLEMMREEIQERKRKLSEAGKKGARKRHSKDGHGEATGQADG